jgi:hypothetical protein
MMLLGLLLLMVVGMVTTVEMQIMQTRLARNMRGDD